MSKGSSRLFVFIAALIWVARVGESGELRLPREWTAFGPFPPPASMAAGGGLPEIDALLPAETFLAIPSELAINGEIAPARHIRADAGGVIDLGMRFGGVERGRTVYLMTALTAPEDTTIRVGAGADWFMHWWLNGEPVYGTLETGNRESPISMDNHRFALNVKAGENILAVAVLSGSRDFLFATGTPGRNRSQPGYAEAMRAAHTVLFDSHAGLSNRWWVPLELDGARVAYREALARAESGSERVAALLALAGTYLMDAAPVDTGHVRELLTDALQQPGIGSAQRAEAYAGLAELALLESRYDAADEAIDALRASASIPPWPAIAQGLAARRHIQARDTAAAVRALDRLIEMPDAEEGRRWEAQAMKAALGLLPQIRRARPRVFLNADRWPAVRAHALGEGQEAYAAMRARVEALEPKEILPGNWGFSAWEAALVYRMTEEPAVLDKAVRMLEAMQVFLMERAGTRSRSYEGIAAVAALDWIWNDLDPSVRHTLADGYLEYVYAMLLESRARRSLPRSAYYYEKDIFFYAGLALLDNDRDDLARARALEMLAAGLWQNLDSLQQRLDRAGNDGAWHLNAGYFLAELSTPQVSFMHAWEGATGERVSPSWWPAIVSPDYAARQVLALSNRPPRLDHFGYSRTASRMGSDLVYDHLGHFIHFFAETHPEKAALAGHLRERIGREARPADGQFPMLAFLRERLRTAPPPGLPEGLPLGRHFENVGLVLMSSGFGPDDTFALFAAGGGALASEHFDTTHFTIYRRGYLAVDSGGRNAGGHGGRDPRDHSPNYWNQTVAHNAVLIRMPGEEPAAPTGEYPPGSANSGGQRYHGSEARVLAFASTPHYVYAATDATATYHEDKCDEMVRQLLFLPPDLFFVFDRVTATQAAYPKSWLLHTAHEPVRTGRGAWRADSGEGRLFVRTLYPEDAETEAIGGPGREFWADGRNWPIPDSWWEARHRRDADHEAMGGWRLWVRPGAERTRDVFLHALQAVTAETPDMIDLQTRVTEDALEVAFTHEGRDVSVRFARHGTVGGHLRIREADRVWVDTPLSTVVLPQRGLALEDVPE